MEKIRGLRRITTTINGEVVTLLTVGHLAHALGRTTWTTNFWMRVGLLPSGPFVINPDVICTYRRLWPESFVDALAEIARRLQLGHRMDRDLWGRFYAEVNRAYGETVVPHFRFGVTEQITITVNQARDARLTVESVDLIADASPQSPRVA